MEISDAIGKLLVAVGVIVGGAFLYMGVRTLWPWLALVLGG